jgi:hypothetical protein
MSPRHVDQVSDATSMRERICRSCASLRTATALLRRSAGAESSDLDSTLEAPLDDRAPARRRKDVKNFPPVDFVVAGLEKDAAPDANDAIAFTPRACVTFCEAQKPLRRLHFRAVGNFRRAVRRASLSSRTRRRFSSRLTRLSRDGTVGRVRILSADSLFFSLCCSNRSAVQIDSRLH